MSVHTEEGQREALRYTSGGRKTGIAGRWPRRPRRTSGPGGLGWTATVRSVHPARRHPRCGQGTGRRARLRCHRDDRDRRPRREALDTVYASAGRKPQLTRLLVKTAISGTDQAVPAGQRAYVRAIQPAPDAATKIYAADIAAIAPHALVPGIIQQAARDESGLAALWAEMAKRRAANMRLVVADLAAVAPLRLGPGQAADIVRATNAAQIYQLLIGQRLEPATLRGLPDRHPAPPAPRRLEPAIDNSQPSTRGSRPQHEHRSDRSANMHASADKHKNAGGHA
ncbi:MAG: hypothetical protein ABSB76_34800 [Streptosporangiaceae bacterium]